MLHQTLEAEWLSRVDEAMVALREAASFPALFEGFARLGIVQLGTRVGTRWPSLAPKLGVLLSDSRSGRDFLQAVPR